MSRKFGGCDLNLLRSPGLLSRSALHVNTSVFEWLAVVRNIGGGRRVKDVVSLSGPYTGSAVISYKYHDNDTVKVLRS